MHYTECQLYIEAKPSSVVTANSTVVPTVDMAIVATTHVADSMSPLFCASHFASRSAAILVMSNITHIYIMVTLSNPHSYIDTRYSAKTRTNVVVL